MALSLTGEQRVPLASDRQQRAPAAWECRPGTRRPATSCCHAGRLAVCTPSTSTLVVRLWSACGPGERAPGPRSSALQDARPCSLRLRQAMSCARLLRQGQPREAELDSHRSQVSAVVLRPSDGGRAASSSCGCGSGVLPAPRCVAHRPDLAAAREPMELAGHPPASWAVPVRTRARRIAPSDMTRDLYRPLN